MIADYAQFKRNNISVYIIPRIIMLQIFIVNRISYINRICKFKNYARVNKSHILKGIKYRILNSQNMSLRTLSVW